MGELSLRKLIVAALVLTAAAPAHKPIGKPVHHGITPGEYAAAVTGLDSCAAFSAKAGTLPDASPLLLTAISDVHATTKDEFETTAQFAARQTAFWQSRLGDPDHLVIRAVIDPFKVSYDADHAEAVVKYFVDYYLPDHHSIDFSHVSQTTGHYVGQNAYGVKANVTSFHDLDAALLFPPQQFGGSDIEFHVPLPPQQAREFKEHPSMLILAKLEPPYLDTEHHYSGATIDEPETLSSDKRNVHVQLRCAVFMSGSQVVSPNLVKAP